MMLSVNYIENDAFETLCSTFESKVVTRCCCAPENQPLICTSKPSTLRMVQN